MKRYILILLALFSVNFAGYAKKDVKKVNVYNIIASSQEPVYRISVGVRGGAVVPIAMTDTKMKIGGDGMFDVHYLMYWHKNYKVFYGFTTGLSLGFQQSGLQFGTLNDQYTTSTDCGVIDYTIQAKDVTETIQQLKVEVPIFFALRVKSFFLNVGPRFTLNAWNRSKVNCSTIDIDAYFPQEGIHIMNQQITGKSDGSAQQFAQKTPTFTLKASAEIGFEKELDNKNAFAFGVYADWACLTFQSGQSAGKWINITNPSNESPAVVTYGSPLTQYINKLSAVNVGVKLCYHISLK